MLLCLQFIISVLTNPTFKYNPINANKVQAKVHISTLTCELTFDNNDITSLAINLRTMWNSKKILPAYHGESGILYRTYLSCIAARNLNKHELQTVYWRYKNNKQKFNIGRDSTEKLYSMLEDHHFKMYAFLQDPVIFAKIVDDLLVKLETKPQS